MSRAAGHSRYGDAAADTWLESVLTHAAKEHARWQALNPHLASTDLPVVRIPVTCRNRARPGVRAIDPDCPAWRALARATADSLPVHSITTSASARLRARNDLRVAAHPWSGAVLVDASFRMRSTARVAVPGVHTWVTLASHVPAWCASDVLATYAGLAGYYDDDYAQLAAALALA